MLNAEVPAPAAVVMTGDLVNDARPDEYAALADLLAPLDAPVLPLPGNHDDRALLRADVRGFRLARHRAPELAARRRRRQDRRPRLDPPRQSRRRVRRRTCRVAAHRHLRHRTMAPRSSPCITLRSSPASNGWTGPASSGSTHSRRSSRRPRSTGSSAATCTARSARRSAGSPHRSRCRRCSTSRSTSRRAAGVSLVRDPVGYQLHRVDGRDVVTHSRYLDTGEQPFVPDWAVDDYA